MSKPGQVPKPFLKWVGGKRQLLAELTRRLPENISRYHEPFLGGGALFFDLAGRGKIKKAFLSDANAELINAYTVVRDEVEGLIVSLEKRKHSEEEFYRIRAQKPETLPPVERASRLIYLNKTCYNGLYRVNSRGEFNTPFGRYKNPMICDAENLRACSRVLQRADLACRPFESVKRRAKKRDFIYFDPPYFPVSRTSNFASYARNGFHAEDHQRLRDIFDDLNNMDCFVMLSNSHCRFTLDLFRAWSIEAARGRFDTIKASRAVNSKSTGRGPVKEILVRNY